MSYCVYFKYNIHALGLQVHKITFTRWGVDAFQMNGRQVYRQIFINFYMPFSKERYLFIHYFIYKDNTPCYYTEEKCR